MSFLSFDEDDDRCENPRGVRLAANTCARASDRDRLPSETSSIQRNNKRVRNAVHVEHGKMLKEFIWLTLLLLCWSVAIVSSVFKTLIILERGIF